MSPPPPPPLTTTTTTTTNSSLGYYIALALAFLILLSVILFSYVCYRSTLSSHRRRRSHPSATTPPVEVYLPRIVFVAEDEDNEENVNSGNAVGLDQAIINSYPRFVYSKKGGGSSDVCSSGGGNETMCSICLCEYREAEMLRMLPDCRHYFHVMCVDAWLKLNSSCPVCRNSPLPTPLSTPLSEVVPLSQYSDGRRRT